MDPREIDREDGLPVQSVRDRLSAAAPSEKVEMGQSSGVHDSNIGRPSLPTQPLGQERAARPLRVNRSAAPIPYSTLCHPFVKKELAGDLKLPDVFAGNQSKTSHGVEALLCLGPRSCPPFRFQLRSLAREFTMRETFAAFPLVEMLLDPQCNATLHLDDITTGSLKWERNYSYSGDPSARFGKIQWSFCLRLPPPGLYFLFIDRT